MTIFHKPLILICFMLSMLLATMASAATPIATDSRIKTFVYNESEVFPITIHYGYQSHIQFAKGEQIETISLGNNFSLKLTPVGERLFIRTLVQDAHTNLTVLTNKRTYHFDIFSRMASEQLDEQLVYVVRFFYPEVSLDMPSEQKMYPAQQAVPIASPLPTLTGNEVSIPPSGAMQTSYNFNYTLAGPDSIAPLKVFDDGAATYMKFPKNRQLPQIFSVGANGQEMSANARIQGDFVVVNKTAGRFALRLGEQVVCVFNEGNVNLTGRF